jgi:hypothetical protein
MADSAAEEKLAQRQVAKYPLQQTRLRHGAAGHGVAWRPGGLSGQAAAAARF